MQDDKTTLPRYAVTGVNLASAGLGARAVSASDAFFAPLSRMLEDAPAVFHPDRYDDNGKWMDGWETRRRRNGGHDHAVIALAAPGRLMGFDVDTAHFTGNYPPACRIEAALVDGDPDEARLWHEILPMQPLGPSAHHYFACADDGVWSHLRLHIYPDGGVARLRAYGRPVLQGEATGELDLASALNGGRVLAFSNAHYGAYQRLLAPGRGRDMGDGWETRRRREPGNDWLIVELGARGRIGRAVIDTCHYKGNYPDGASLQAADLADFTGGLDQAVVTSAMFWPVLLERRPLTADAIHELGSELLDVGPVTHVRLNIYPDGGVSRLRLFGHRA